MWEVTVNEKATFLNAAASHQSHKKAFIVKKSQKSAMHLYLPTIALTDVAHGERSLKKKDTVIFRD